MLYAAVLGKTVQAEFEKEDIYEDLKLQEEKTDFSKMPAAAAEALKAEFFEKRFIVRICSTFSTLVKT